MNWKRLLTCVAFLLTFALWTNAAQAEPFKDVDSEHWAVKEIEKCVYSGYLKLDENGHFAPLGTISRVDFISALLRVLRSEDIQVVERSSFKDVGNKTRGQHSILTSRQMRIIYGYPDKTFKPESNVTRSETMSIIANITKKFTTDTSVLDKFYDQNSIPGWARALFAKNIRNNLYVNYPDPDMLRPNDKLTRAEAAVLLAKISENLELVEAKYLGKQKDSAIFVRNEYLNTYAKAPRNVVEIWNIKLLVEAGNVFPAKFESNINSKSQSTKVGDLVNFVVVDDIYTNENTLVIPAQTRFDASVVKIEKTKWKEKNSKALLTLNKAKLPDGTVIPVAAVPLTKSGKLVPIQKNTKHTSKNYQEESKTDFLINYSRVLYPVVKYDNKIGDGLYILLTGDLVIPYEEL
ncbi:S-layer homology domain [Candidatus Gastranaerophilus sp. (ex Termes propinquus)]|nr:S-layer homology domain [Candidatus Gastranaerophilus sp. (ex Termes propinquus)]